MTTFNTRVKGIPCQCEIVEHTPFVPMRITGPGMGDADPPEGGEVVFQLRDRKGYLAPWLENLLNESMRSRIEEECLTVLEGSNREFVAEFG